MRSSYVANNYADAFRAIVSAIEPKLCVELGCLEGYSTIAIAQGLKDNHRKGGAHGCVVGHDLFEDYPYHSSTMVQTQKNVDEAGVSEFVMLRRGNAMDAHELYEERAVDLIHVDLSNTGDTVKSVMQNWDSKMVYGGVILIEGGTEERDKVPWMIDSKAPPIKRELERNQIIKENYIFGTYMKFPGLTHLLKKR